MASEKLVEVALKRFADDNVTAVVVLLNPVAEAPSSAAEDRRSRPHPLSARRGVSLADLVALEDAGKLAMGERLPEASAS